MLACGEAPFDKVTLAEMVQPLPSVTVTLYVPGERLTIVWVVWLLLHWKEYGALLPDAVAVAVPLLPQLPVVDTDTLGAVTVTVMAALSLSVQLPMPIGDWLT